VIPFIFLSKINPLTSSLSSFAQIINISAIFRLLDPNGRLIIIEPSKRWMDEETGQHRLRDTLVCHGFTIVQEHVMTEEQRVHKFSLFVAKK